MKVHHVFTMQNYVYSQAMIEMLSAGFDGVDNQFFICEKEEKVPQEIKAIQTTHPIRFLQMPMRWKGLALHSQYKNADLVMFHFLPNDLLFHSLMLLSRKKPEHTAWCVWGADLYNWRKSGSPVMKVFNLIRGTSRRRLKFVLASPIDFEEYKRQFDNNAVLLRASGPKGYDAELLESLKPDRQSSAFRILVGHSATPSVHHMEILDKLKAYGNENIELILPLNYGDQEYGKKVEEYARKAFGPDKVMCISEKLTLLDYAKLIWSTDAVIIHSDRQIAMGNLLMAMYMEKKIFLKKDSVMDRYFRQQLKLAVSDSNSIGAVPFSDFSEKGDQEKNKVYAAREIDYSQMVSDWAQLFKVIEGKLKES